MLDARAGKMLPVLDRAQFRVFQRMQRPAHRLQRRLYFTDQGQTGLHDPTGRVYRLTAGGRLDGA